MSRPETGLHLGAIESIVEGVSILEARGHPCVPGKPVFARETGNA